MAKRKLAPKQEAFCHEYLVDLNATQAAIRAGYTKNAAGEAGYSCLKKTHVQERIAELKAKRAEKVGITAEFVLEGIKRHAEESDDPAISLKAYDLLGKHAGIYESHNQQKKPEITAIQVKFVE